MRIVTAIMVVLIGVASQGCAKTGVTDTQTNTAQCASGQHAISSTDCAWNPVIVAIGPTLATDGCPVFSPNPVAVHTNQLVEWTNNYSAAVTVYQFEGFNNGVAPLPLTSVNPGQTSGGVYWSTAESISVFTSKCSGTDWGSITITVN